MENEKVLSFLLKASQTLLTQAEKLDRKFISGLSRSQLEVLEKVRKNVYRAQMILDLATLAWYEREEDGDKGKG